LRFSHTERSVNAVCGNNSCFNHMANMDALRERMLKREGSLIYKHGLSDCTLDLLYTRRLTTLKITIHSGASTNSHRVYNL
jgi:hypothetical protein